MALETYAAFIDCEVFEAAAPSSPILCRGVDRALQTNTDNSNSKKARSVTFRRGIFCLPVERNCGGCDSGTLLVFAFTCSTRASKCEPASSAKPGSVLRRFPQKSCCVTASPPPPFQQNAWIFVLLTQPSTGQQPADIFGGGQNDCKLLLYYFGRLNDCNLCLATKRVFKNFGKGYCPVVPLVAG